MHPIVQFFALFEKSVDEILDIVSSMMIFSLLLLANLDLVDSVLDFILADEDLTFQIFHHGYFVLKASW